MAGTIDDTFEKMLRTFSRRLARLERKAGSRAGGSAAPAAQVVTMERADRIVPSGTVLALTGYTDITVRGGAMTPGAFSIAINRAGWYDFSAAVRWEPNTVGTRQLRIMSGTELILAYVETSPSKEAPGAGICAQAVSSGAVYLDSSFAAIRASVYQGSGSSLALANHSEGQLSTNYLRAHYLGE